MRGIATAHTTASPSWRPKDRTLQRQALALGAATAEQRDELAPVSSLDKPQVGVMGQSSHYLLDLGRVASISRWNCSLVYYEGRETRSYCRPAGPGWR
jgi:hypothetical protein